MAEVHLDHPGEVRGELRMLLDMLGIGTPEPPPAVEDEPGEDAAASLDSPAAPPTPAPTRRPEPHPATRGHDPDAPHWSTRGACRRDPELHHPIGTTGPSLPQIAQAKQVCSKCPVLVRCREWALTAVLDDKTVAGGLTGRERRKLRQGTGRGVVAGAA